MGMVVVSNDFEGRPLREREAMLRRILSDTVDAEEVRARMVGVKIRCVMRRDCYDGSSLVMSCSSPQVFIIDSNETFRHAHAHTHG